MKDASDACSALRGHGHRRPRGHERILVLGLVLAAAWLRWNTLDRRDLWIDEAFSLWMAKLAWSDLLHTVIALDHHPPLYYGLLRLWVQIVGESESALRLLSVWFSIATVPVFYRIARRVLRPRGAMAATALLVFAPFHVEYAQEARMYALLAFAASITFWGAVTLLHTRQFFWWPAVGLGLGQAATMLSHNTAAVLFPVTLNLAAVIWLAQTAHSDHRWRRWLTGQLIALAVWTSWAPAFVRQAQTVRERFWVPMPTLDTIWLAFQSHTIGHPPAGWPAVAVWVILLLGLVGVGVWQISHRTRVRLVWIILWLGGPALAVLISVYRPVFLASTLIWTTLPLYLLLGAGIDGVLRWRGAHQRTHPKNWLVAGLASCAIIGIVSGFGAGLAGFYTSPPREAWRQAAAHVAEQVQPGDLLLFHASWTQLPFDYYATANGGVDAAIDAGVTRRGVPVDLFARGELEPPMTPADQAALAQSAADFPRVWLIYSHQWYTDPDGLVLETLAQEFYYTETAHFRGVDVWYFCRRGLCNR